MSHKREARVAYYHGLKEALTEHMVTTENCLRSLPGTSKAKIDEIVAAVHKRHEKLLRRVDQELADEFAFDAERPPWR